MLTIRKKQMAAFQQTMEVRFEDWMIRHLKAKYPKKAVELDNDSMRKVIHRGIGRAESHGITDEQHLVTYLELVFELGMDFEELPEMSWARQIFDNPTIPGKDKIPLIQQIRHVEDS